MLAAAPRCAIHVALAKREPQSYWAAQPENEQLGISPSMEDAAIAYRLLTEVRFGVLHFGA